MFGMAMLSEKVFHVIRCDSRLISAVGSLGGLDVGVEPYFWPSLVRIGLFSNFNVFHPVIGGWNSSGVAEEGDCH